MTCKHCTEEDGSCLLPRTSIHVGDVERPGFTPSPHTPHFGTQWCQHCGEGRPFLAGQKSLPELWVDELRFQLARRDDYIKTLETFEAVARENYRRDMERLHAQIEALEQAQKV